MLCEFKYGLQPEETFGKALGIDQVVPRRYIYLSLTILICALKQIFNNLRAFYYLKKACLVLRSCTVHADSSFLRTSSLGFTLIGWSTGGGSARVGSQLPSFLHHRISIRIFYASHCCLKYGSNTIGIAVQVLFWCCELCLKYDVEVLCKFLLQYWMETDGQRDHGTSPVAFPS